MQAWRQGSFGSGSAACVSQTLQRHASQPESQNLALARTKPTHFLLFGSGLRGLAEERAPRPMAPISNLGRRISKPGFWTAVQGTRNCEAQTQLAPALQPAFLKNRLLVPALCNPVRIAQPGDGTCEAHSRFFMCFFAPRPAPQSERRVTDPELFSSQAFFTFTQVFQHPKKSEPEPLI